MWCWMRSFSSMGKKCSKGCVEISDHQSEALKGVANESYKVFNWLRSMNRAHFSRIERLITLHANWNKQAKPWRWVREGRQTVSSTRSAGLLTSTVSSMGKKCSKGCVKISDHQIWNHWRRYEWIIQSVRLIQIDEQSKLVSYWAVDHTTRNLKHISKAVNKSLRRSPNREIH